MVVVGAACCVVFEPIPECRFCVVWDGGPWATVHHVHNGTYGGVLERWEMHDAVTGCPRMSCTPDALAELTRFRFDETPGAFDLVREHMTPAGTRGKGALAG
jgi:hypothetical protein